MPASRRSPATSVPDRSASAVAGHFASSFAQLGLRTVAYTRTVLLAGRTAYAVHAADGTCLWLDADRDQARAVLLGHGLQLVSLH